ncbi:MAG: hypothetical protein H0X37_03705 [Herpetosiphonaceae bacterium]|nr:hypothetical protein [Herpetosiphonaceae bacterium]
MSIIRRRPYATPTSEHVKIGAWNIMNGDDMHQLPAFLPDWDPAVVIHASVPVRVDYAGVLADCHLGPDARLRLAAIWTSPGTGLRDHGDLIDLDSQNINDQFYASVRIDGTLVSHEVQLTTQLVLLSPGKSAHPLAPKLPGSIVVAQTQTLQLEGKGSRFPVEVIDFASTYYPDRAAWVLYWDEEDLHQTVLGHMCLYINARHTRVMRAVSQLQLEDVGIREAIRLDVARTLLLGALNHDEFLHRPQVFAEGSVGAAIYAMTQLYFPGTSLTQLGYEAAHSSLFEPKLQATLQAFWDI